MVRPRRAKQHPILAAINITIMFCVAACLGVMLGLLADKYL